MPGTTKSGNPLAVYKGPRCNGSKKGGDPCRAPAMQNGKCAVHGGKTPGGMASVHWRTGRHSKYLGPALGPLVADALSDPDRHSMDAELGLIDARMAQLLQSIEGKDGPADWTRLSEALDRFHKAAALPPKSAGPAMAQAMGEVDQLVKDGLGETAVWGEVTNLIEQRRKLVESEEKRAVTSGQAIPVAEVMNMIAAFSRAVLDDVPDADKRRRIADRVRAIMHGRRLPMADLPHQILDASRG